MSDYDYMYEGYDDVEASEGFSGDPLPSGWYPLTVAKLMEKQVSRNGVPMARVQLRVDEGAAKGQMAFVTIVMGASQQNQDGSARSVDEVKTAARRTQGLLKGWLKAIGVTTGQPVGEGPDAVFSFFNTDMWEGRQFMGKLQYKEQAGYAPKNNLTSFVGLEDEKHGLEKWRVMQDASADTTKAATI